MAIETEFAAIKLRMLEQKFLRLCLRARLAAVASTAADAAHTHLESQIVVVRLSITCACPDGTLRDGEVCARLEPIERQRWTGFMGDARNGLY